MDMFDDDLMQVLGVRYDDGDTTKEMPVMERKTIRENQAKPTKLVEKTECPFPKPPKVFMDKLMGCATWAMVCGGIAMLLWWFEINGLMAHVAAFPCIVVCCLLAGFGVGKNIK